MKRLVVAVLGALLAGCLYGLAEAGAVLESRLWIRDAGTLLAAGAMFGALVALPGVLLELFARKRDARLSAGILGGAAAIALFESALAVLTDPPPFQEPPWWVGNPLAGLVGLVAIAGIWALVRRGPIVLMPLPMIALLALPALGVQDTLAPSAGAGGPNLLLVTLDTTRADHIGAYGYEQVETPAFDALADQGVIFDNAMASIAVTGPSHSTMHSGQGTWTHGTLLNGIPAPPDHELLAERLHAQGYRTGAFVSAYVLDGGLGFSRGFEVYDDDFGALKGAHDLLAIRLRDIVGRFLDPNEVLERRGDFTTGDAVHWLDSAEDDRPWFLWVHLFDPHGPYSPPEPWDTRFYTGDPRDPANTSMDQVDNVAVYLQDSLKGITDVDWVIAQYDGEISFADQQIAKLLDTVEQRGETDETLVIVTGDHGEAFGEHGVWFNHGDDVYEPNIRVPLVMRYPSALPAGERVDAMVEHTDSAPTIYELFGMEPLASTDGVSLIGTWDGTGTRNNARSLVYDREANMEARKEDPTLKPTLRLVGLRSQDALFVHRESAKHGDELYLTAQGRGEAEVGPGFHPVDEVNRVDSLGSGVRNGLRLEAGVLLEGDADRSTMEVGDEERKRLEALGYIE